MAQNSASSIDLPALNFQTYRTSISNHNTPHINKMSHPPPSPFMPPHNSSPLLPRGGSIFEDASQKRGFIVVIILSLLATFGMFGLIITLVILKNKRDRRRKAAKMTADKGSMWPGAPKKKTGGRYQKLEDDERDGVWSADMEMEMDERGGNAAYSGSGYGVSVGVGSGGRDGREAYRPVG